MIAESNIKPANFEIENIQKDRCDIVFYTNIQEITELDETKKYTYEVYRLNFCYNTNLEDEIKNKYEEYLEIARKKEYNTLAEEIRKKRNELLAETDKEMCIDRLNIELPTELTAATLLTGVKNFFEGFSNIFNGNMAKYRQELRDITEQEGFPYNVIWPSKEDQE